jgi:Protein of unknown function (DUF2892)
MELGKLMTLRFARNVGGPDRVARLVSGAGLAVAGWAFDVPTGAAIAMTVGGVMWLATGVLSKCSIYYLLGYSTCPARERRASSDA